MTLAMKMRPVAAALLALVFACSPAGGATTDPLPGVKRVLFLGDSITYAGNYIEFVEFWFATRLPGRSIEFINAGLPSETVSGLSEEGHAGGQFPRPDLHERLTRVLSAIKPDMVIACYGMNDGIYLPYAESRFAKYKEGMTRLRQQCLAAGAKVLFMTPPVFDEKQGGKPGYTHTLDRYSQWLATQSTNGWDVVDLHSAMSVFLENKRKTDPFFYLAKDGVHPGDLGHWIMARQLIIHLGAKDLQSCDTPEAMVGAYPDGAAVLGLVQQKQRLMKDAWLTHTKHVRPGMKTGLPMQEATAKAALLDEQVGALTRVATVPVKR